MEGIKVGTSSIIIIFALCVLLLFFGDMMEGSRNRWAAVNVIFHDGFAFVTYSIVSREDAR